MELEKILAARVEELKSRKYSDLLNLTENQIETEEVLVNNKEYQIDTKCFIEDKVHKVIRVTISIYESKELAPWWKFWENIDSPALSESFIVEDDKTL